ncbi:MBL fold metallo-hydrolase [Lipingzhangella sp. LS1_29]|uniref:MBL fold metallo-hydrolase n=1 Tax=Lipingzhangella rawalii TaxID=2055835 RepID=A0ABU2H6C5_9ACTN|nr:MBL fold metallo-hydrolase [Lipingzhangella rawalii]MDS1270399.1 MBL fold metallo-hydrolase [Lipingzhangella rawalii]
MTQPTESTRPPNIPVDHIVTSGVVRRGGLEWDVDTNVWMVGNDRTAIVLDAAHDAQAVARALGDRELMAIVCTHGHHGHINAAVELAELTDSPILLHPDDDGLWHPVYPDRPPDAPLLAGERLQAGDVELRVLHTPGHTPGGVCLYAPDIGTVFTGDTLLWDGPGSTRAPEADPALLVRTIREQLLSLPVDTVVLPGHGSSTTVGAATDVLAGR